MASIDIHFPIITELAKKSRIIVEIGVHRANTTKAILQVINDTSSKLISIDKENPIDFKSNSPQWTFIKCDCVNYSISLPIHFLLIDCDPDPVLLLKILEIYGKKVKNYIFIHDTLPLLELPIMAWAIENNFNVLILDRRFPGCIVLEK